ncbi:hypothetical protein IEQ34_006390 [Dendrobium chrysotoxum]|uniref:Uncharacterized protein n=1 Tax=Dendrobium chrysotoxum TaxID=161865 RepID=A0AAV7HBN7_DENCH|nr:hypothetical protein IEQ34_006390 [Dendrobium chrysotoxum]
MDGCPILFPNLGAAPPARVGTVADVPSSHELDGLNINPAIDSVGVVQGDMVENQDFICAHENDGVVYPLLNDVGHEIIPFLAKALGDVVFLSAGGFVSPIMNTQAATGVQLIGSDDVGACAMALSHVEVEEEGEEKRVSCQAKVCYNLSGVTVTPASFTHSFRDWWWHAL